MEAPLTKEEFTGSLIGFGNLATASGLSAQEQAFALLLTALGIADRNSPGGCSRETFVKMAETVYDKSRKALGAGHKN